MIDPDMIPPEALEAAARAAYETPIPGASSWGEKPWEEVDGMLREYFVWQASAAIAAALEAWKPSWIETEFDNAGVIISRHYVLDITPEENPND